MDSPVLKPQYVTDANGERVAVIISMAEYAEISELLEDLADTAVIEQRRKEHGIPHREAMRLVRDDSALSD